MVAKHRLEQLVEFARDVIALQHFRHVLHQFFESFDCFKSMQLERGIDETDHGEADGFPVPQVTVYPSAVIVNDRGQGIDPSVAEHLFERFHSGPTSQGHGLGLSIVKWIVEAHGGTITMANRGGGGAVATIGLPK